MNSSPRLILLSAACALAASGLVFLLTSGAEVQAGDEPRGAAPAELSAPAQTPSASAAPAVVIPDAALATYQRRLLEVAFRTASKFPLHPHVKDRSRLQEEVVTACLGLDQPATALDFLQQIANWRKGSAYAELALYGLEHGIGQQVRPWLESARTIADQLALSILQELEDDGVESPQDWHHDVIRAKIAQALLWNGEDARAAEIEAGLVDSESGRVDAMRAQLADESDFDAQLTELDTLVKGANLDHARHAVEACVRLFDRFYADVERRGRVQEALVTSGAKLPPDIHIEALARAAECALAHDDKLKARELVEAAQKRLDGAQCWLPEHQVPLMARLVGLRQRAGDGEGAALQVAAALSLFEAKREEVVDIYRADMLLPLAEAYHALGDDGRARELYRRALEEAVHNPNSRPRAEDLTAACLSMAENGVEPDEELWRRIFRTHDQLGAPW